MWPCKLFLCALFLTASSLKLNLKDVNEYMFTDEIEAWTETELESELFKQAIEILKLPNELQYSDWRTFGAGRDAGICLTCKAVVRTFIRHRRKGMTTEKIVDKITKLCSRLNIQSQRVCKGAVELNAPIIVHIVDSKPNLTAPTICGAVLETKFCSLSDPEFEWTVTVDSNPKAEMEKRTNGKQNKILQITDFHYDPNYEPFGNADCKEPVCCRKGQNVTKNKAIAGYWGDYGSCDTPWHAIVDTLDHIKETHLDLNYVYFTGDIIDHGVWETTKAGNTESLKKSYGKIFETFEGIPVYPILGNHEPHPLNQFAPTSVVDENFSTNWLYELIATLWINHGLPESTRSTILKGGFYTVSPEKGFRIIVLNSNVCYSYNWWIFYSPQDPYGQLQWLADTLLEAEKNNEFVHILSHVPINSKSCLQTWRREYLKIISRFSHVVTAQFNGHSHNDELAVLYDNEGVPNNIAWNGGSVTSYSQLNPNYKVFTVDSNDYAVTDYENWIYDLGAANKQAQTRPTWYKSYSFKEEYNLKDLSVKSVSDWLSVAAKNKTLLEKYYRNFYKRAEPSLQKNKCDRHCKTEYLCRAIAASAANVNSLCGKL